MARLWIKESPSFLGKEISLYGWVSTRRDHGKIIFIDLRDRTGEVQVIFSPDKSEVYYQAQKLRPEWVVEVKGKVNNRPRGMENPKIPTGQIEIEAINLKIISESRTPPFDLSKENKEPGEEIRLKYRYLDLRRKRLFKNLFHRFEVTKFIRDYLAERGFIEIETPYLTKSTPEGARDYVVPSRLEAGKFYALPQSPQQYKQLLMVAGVERYFQIVRCFRDEDSRGDRQPEFTQLDLEMDFPTQEEILNLIENLLKESVEKIYPGKKIKTFPFPRLTYSEAMEKYNSDKPDLRDDKNNKNELAFAFVVDFPLFEWKETEKRWDAVHHPFTRPKFKAGETEEDLIKRMKEKPALVLADQYDVVLNGFEIGGGSLRIHEEKLLEAVFEIMGHRPEEIRKKFGHLLEAFSFGAPPHGGVALGLDRLMMVLENEQSVREVIAFPKTGDGKDLMMAAPSEINDEQLKELHLKIIT
ncbi:MAG: aspartate--tRNA ligase [Candidatus Paceibacterota bacterium]|nr:aspartate--tRNA ligase [Candidatus Paceibacterota bacterium]MDD3548553.1 aspartate--tRNA ligase [Candidatus Paceibacterota bacterium]MDD4999096.1 aspartate--tRNA ligase [Candidatus Paceibacterota bacterium]